MMQFSFVLIPLVNAIVFLDPSHFRKVFGAYFGTLEYEMTSVLCSFCDS